MRRFDWLVILLTVSVAGCRLGDERLGDVLRHVGHVERLDPALDALVPRGTQIEVVAEGFEWAEGPVWIDEQGGYLLFSDIPPNQTIKWQSGAGTSVYLQQSGYLGPIPRPQHIAPDEPGANGLLLDLQGRLVLCQHGERQVGRMNAPLSAPLPEYTALAKTFGGKRLNSPNDATFHKNGDLYFTDPPYGLTRKMQDPNKDLDFQGVYRATPDGTVTLLTKQMSRPNGIAFSPDYQTLYVANSDPERAIWMAFPVKPDGTLDSGRVLFDATAMVGERKGLPDGLKVDVHGNLFATGPGGVLILTPEGKHLGTLWTGEATSNCAFGENGSTLFVTADSLLLRIATSTVASR
tara:strand:+ start:2839 stop:3888 length:1050 start_codon:yes stop_codon:yes gene_type:complete